jgi:mono/diheme cytochrome c family protein
MRRAARLAVVVATPILLALTLAAVVAAPAAGALDGRQVFLDQKCNMCHGVAAAGIAAKVTSGKMAGPELGGITERVEADWVKQWVRQEATRDGAKHQKKFTGSDEELAALIDWLASPK